MKRCEENGVWDRKMGLAGVWGPIVRSWLEEILPSDAAQRCHSRVSRLAVYCSCSSGRRQNVMTPGLALCFWW